MASSVAKAPPIPDALVLLSTPLAARPFEGRGLACRRGERLVFKALDFALTPGGALLLTGANGSGKSSLLRLMAGLTPPLAGALTWDGAAVTGDLGTHRPRVHFVGHQDSLKPVLTVAETLAFSAALRETTSERVAPALEAFHLTALADWPCRVLSAGQRRRLALARLLASPAPLWLLDEPSTGLDEASTCDLLTAIAAHRSGGGMVAIATHLPLPIPGAASLSLEQFAPQRSAA
ncbi:MAG TPA: heme ABC exporter ATP-binding protein CcmA [Stellaceae bacterium]|nr:heme ABC exporter ATP-binding protein CcmA [Stellaceae bacterium]